MVDSVIRQQRQDDSTFRGQNIYDFQQSPNSRYGIEVFLKKFIDVNLEIIEVIPDNIAEKIVELRFYLAKQFEETDVNSDISKKLVDDGCITRTPSIQKPTTKSSFEPTSPKVEKQLEEKKSDQQDEEAKEVEKLSELVKLMVKFYKCISGIIEVKCKVVKMLLEAHTNCQDFLVDYIEKWQLHSYTMSILDIKFAHFNNFVNSVYEHQSLCMNSIIEAKFSLWRMCISHWVKHVYKPLSVRY